MSGTYCMQLLGRGTEVFPPAKTGNEGLAGGSAFERFTQCERQNIRFSIVHSLAHLGMHRHGEIAHERLRVV